MGFKLSKAEFNKMLEKNPNLQIRDAFGDDIDIGGANRTTQSTSKQTKIVKTKTSVDTTDTQQMGDNPSHKKSKSGVLVTLENVHEALRESTVSYHIEENGILMVFDGAKILSRNQTDTLKEIKYKNMLLSQYKKTWFTKTHDLLLNMFVDELEGKVVLPNFKDERVRLYLYRETDKRLYDEDNLVTGFKYLIDGLRQTVQLGSLEFNLLPDDNQKHIGECVAYQVKGKCNRIAIRILRGSNKPDVQNFDDFLNLD